MVNSSLVSGRTAYFLGFFCVTYLEVKALRSGESLFSPWFSVSLYLVAGALMDRFLRQIREVQSLNFVRCEILYWGESFLSPWFSFCHLDEAERLCAKTFSILTQVTCSGIAWLVPCCLCFVVCFGMFFYFPFFFVLVLAAHMSTDWQHVASYQCAYPCAIWHACISLSLHHTWATIESEKRLVSPGVDFNARFHFAAKQKSMDSGSLPVSMWGIGPW